MTSHEGVGIERVGPIARITLDRPAVMVWRDDEFNFFRERNERGGKGALDELRRRYAEWGFD